MITHVDFPGGPSQRRSGLGVRRAGAIWHACVFVCFASAAIEFVALLALATFVGGMAFATRDYLRRGPLSFTAMSVYAFSSGVLFGGANFALYISEGSRYQALFYGYGAFDYTYEAQVIATTGMVVPLLAYDWLRKIRWAGGKGIFPGVGFTMWPKGVTRFALCLVFLSWALRIAELPLGALGTFKVFLELGPAIGIFVLRMNHLDHGVGERPRVSGRVIFGIVIIEVVYQVLFGFLRTEAIWPVVGFLAPDMLRKQLSRRTLVVAGSALLGFVLVFQPLASLRQSTGGLSRAPQLLSSEYVAHDVKGPYVVVGALDVVARLSTINQLSQVARLAEEDGLQGGRTMSGAAFVFVPRIFWPDKPSIVPGQWFAERLGRGQPTATGFSNAINMTVPGELYLNFGWVGMLGGLVVLALLYAVVWDAVGHLMENGNVVALSLGMVLITQALFVGSSAVAVIQIFLVYMAALAFGWAHQVFAGRRPGAGRPVSLARPR